MRSWVLWAYLQVGLPLDSMQAVKTEFRTRRSALSKCFPVADFDVDLTLVNAGPVVQVAHVFWQPFLPFRFCFLSVCFGQILLFFFSHFCSRLRSPPTPFIVSLCVSCCFSASLSQCLSLPLSFLPTSSLLPPSLFIIGFLVQVAYDDNSVTTMWKLRSDTENRKYCCLLLPGNVGTLGSTLGTYVQKVVLSPFPFAMWCLVDFPYRKHENSRLSPTLSHCSSIPAPSMPCSVPSPALGSSYLLMSWKESQSGNLVRGPGMWTCFSFLQKGSVMLGTRFQGNQHEVYREWTGLSCWCWSVNFIVFSGSWEPKTMLCCKKWRSPCL